MSLLQAVEDHLGSIDTWPVSIINYLFVDTPSPAVIEELTAFFTGNGVPKTLAYWLYRACNPPAANELMRQLFYTRYSLWHTSDTGASPAITMYVSKNRYASTFHTSLMSSLVFGKIPYLFPAYLPRA